MHLNRSLSLEQRCQIWFLRLWGVLWLAWAVGVCVTGQFRFGARGGGSGGPVITPETEPDRFWAVVSVAVLLGSAAIVASLVPYFRTMQRERRTK